jgi:hypothetical protein
MADMVSMTLRCFRIGSMVGIASIKGHNLSPEVCRSPRRQMQRGVGKIFAVKSSETANILQTLLCRAPSNKIINQPESSGALLKIIMKTRKYIFALICTLLSIVSVFADSFTVDIPNGSKTMSCTFTTTSDSTVMVGTGKYTEINKIASSIVIPSTVEHVLPRLAIMPSMLHGI